MSGESVITTDHDTIRHWVEDRGGHPAVVKSTQGAQETGLLRIDFPGYSGEQSLEPVSWDAFFEKFDHSDLAFLYQDTTKDGQKSRFNKIVNRDEAS